MEKTVVIFWFIKPLSYHPTKQSNYNPFYALQTILLLPCILLADPSSTVYNMAVQISATKFDFTSYTYFTACIATIHHITYK